jgi:predicted ArsR family transcriptional regulator
MSDTPRTDKAAFPPPEALVTADFARELERELARVTAENARLTADFVDRDIKAQVLASISIVLSQRTADLAQRTAERDALKERLAVVGEIARLAPELNPNNYDHDEVCQLNDAMIALAKEVKP